MKRALIAFTASSLAIADVLFSYQAGTTRAPRELILHNAKVVTLDDNSRVASALAIRDDRIVAVGDLPDVRTRVGSSAELLDVGGRTVVPGMIDTHAHLDMQALATMRIDFAGAKSIPEILSRIKAETARHPPGTWIVTEPIGEPPHWFNMPDGLAEKRFPDRTDLDKVAPDHPVFIRGPLVRSLSVSIANSRALKEAGITRDTSPPSGVTILKDGSGEPTGIFEERSWPGPLVQQTLFRMIPGVSIDTYGFPDPGLDKTAELLKATIASRAAMGLTGIYEGHGLSAASIRAYKKLHDNGELRMRVYAPILFDARLPMNEIEAIFDTARSLSGKGLGDEWLTLGGVSGNVVYPSEKFRPILEAAAARGLRVNAICSDYPIVGKANPRGMNECLAVMEDVDRKFPIKHLRWVVYHVKTPSPDTFEVMKRLNVVPTSTFNGIDRDGIEYVEKYGGDIASRLLPFKAMMRAGVPIALGSDLYPPSPMFGLWMAVARKDGRTGRVIGAHEALSRQEALRGYTLNPSYASFREDVSGTLEPGKLADLVVLSADILTVPDDEIRNLRSLLTLVGGRVTHKDALFKSLVGTMN